MPWWETLIRVTMAVLVGCVIGLERERKHRPAGMRTHVLVCVGAAMIAVLETLMLSDTMALNAPGAATGVAVSRGRMAAQVISGIGFLGAGTIFVSKKKITGLTTAASLWNTACLGLAIGMGYYALAAMGCTAVLLTLTLMQRLVTPRVVRHMEIRFVNYAPTVDVIRKCLTELSVRVIDTDVHVAKAKGGVQEYTILYTLDMPGKLDTGGFINRLADMKDVLYVHMVQNES